MQKPSMTSSSCVDNIVFLFFFPSFTFEVAPTAFSEEFRSPSMFPVRFSPWKVYSLTCTELPATMNKWNTKWALQVGASALIKGQDSLEKINAKISYSTSKTLARHRMFSEAIWFKKWSGIYNLKYYLLDPSMTRLQACTIALAQAPNTLRTG